MRLEQTALSHPTRRRLVVYAESLVDRRAPVSALMANHVAGCQRCSREVTRIRSSLELAALAATPEPSRDLTSRILAQARAARRGQGQPPRSGIHTTTLFQSAACLLGVLLVAWFSFSTALNGRPAPSHDRPIAQGADIALDSPGSLRQQTAVVQALFAAVTHQQETLSTLTDKDQRRTLELLDQDLNAALAALERNPGNPRANQVVHKSLERQLEGLRNLYLDRTL